MMTIEELAKFFTRASVTMHGALRVAAKDCRDNAVDIARAKFGHYQGQIGPFAAWPPLAESTIEDKVDKGFSPPDNPLLRTGETRDSVNGTIEDRGRSFDIEVGSDSEIMKYHEYGTVNMPPRPVLEPAAYEAADATAEHLGKALAIAIDEENPSIVHMGNKSIVKSIREILGTKVK